jgi:patatin-like phospholipase/acyl hydrolase
MATTPRILSLDGGGIRGIIPATVLAEIETRTGARIAELFDLVAGTSTGGILALGLVKPSEDDPTQPQYKASDLAELYEKEGKHIFARSPWHRLKAVDNLLDEKYDAGGLEKVLQSYFGDAKLSQAVTETLVTSYEIEKRSPWFFARHKALASSDFDFPMRFVARATSAAPTYFEPEALPGSPPPGGLIDGGVYANNPAMCAYVEAKKLYGNVDEMLVVSLGTGQHTRPIHYGEAKGWGLAMWAKPILDVVFDGVSDTVDHQLQLLCEVSDGEDPRYYRFQTELNVGSDDMDNVTNTNMAALKQKAQELIEAQDADLNKLCAELKARLAAPVPAGAPGS